MPAFRYGDLEADLIAYLTSVIPDTEVRDHVPNERNEPWPKNGQLIVVRDDGGWPKPNKPHAARHAGIRVFALTKEAAVDLATEVTAQLNAWPGRQVTAGLARPVPEESGRPCRYLTATIIERGTQI